MCWGEVWGLAMEQLLQFEFILMDNYMFITTQIAENRRSSSPSAETPVRDGHCAYLNKRKMGSNSQKACMIA